MTSKEKKNKKIKNILISIFCIAIGTLVGLFSLFLFYTFNIAIFGFNLGLILSPLIAGYVETFIADKVYGKTTGAVSALLLFIITVLYGFIYLNTSLGVNIITIVSAAVILQAAFPTFVNYFLFVVVLGALYYILNAFKAMINRVHIIFKKLYYIIIRKEYVEETGKMDYDEDMDKIDINKLGVLFLSTTSFQNKKIKRFKGIFEGKILIQNERSPINSKSAEKGEFLIKNLQKARDQALINLAEDVKKENCNAILDLTMEFDTLGGLTEDNIHIIARGTGVGLE